MNIQDEGFIGKMVGGMLRRGVRSSFRAVYWLPPSFEVKPPVLFFANHHGWFDGHMAYHLAGRLGVRTLDWMQEFDTFPPFRWVGARPFRVNDPLGRAKTVRETIHLMQSEARSLFLFPEGELHYPPEVWSFGKSFEFMIRKVPSLQVVPVAMSYRQSIHQKPEAFLSVGSPMEPGGGMADRARIRLIDQLAYLRQTSDHPEKFETLVAGKPSVNEKWDMKRLPK